MTATDVQALKGRGFLRNKGTDCFSARVVTVNGTITSEQMRGVAAAADVFGNGVVTFTTRQSIEVQGIPFEKTDDFVQVMKELGLSVGGTGPRVRPVVACKGTTCPCGLIDTFSLAGKIYRRFYEGWHDVALPGKFKIGVGGCPNNCVKPNLNDVGVVGRLLPGGVRVYALALGGHWGRTGGEGRFLEATFATEDAVLDAIEKVLVFYRDHAQKGERFFKLLDRVGFETLAATLGEVAP